MVRRPAEKVKESLDYLRLPCYARERMHDRFFETTRGRIVGALREQRSASAADLATAFGLSPNAIRQQLLVLERDGLVTGKSVRRSRTKPTVEYALTAEAERYFPQRYDKMLNAVLREIREAGGDDAVKAVFDRIGSRAAQRLDAPVDGSAEAKIGALVARLRERGVSAEMRATERGTIEVHEHNCPYASVVAENPEACSAIHTMIAAAVPGAHVDHTDSLATGADRCTFEITLI